MKQVRVVVVVVGIGLLLMITSACVSSAPAVSTSPSDAIALLPCQDVMKIAPPSDFSIVFDSVALPTGRALQANRSSVSDSAAWLFAKSGLFIRRGTSFDLVVPDEWRGRLTIGWGGAKGTHLRVSECRPTGTVNPIQERDAWIVYAGGYWVPEPACVSVLVKAGQVEQTVYIGVGASCPGQGPPPPPV